MLKKNKLNAAVLAALATGSAPAAYAQIDEMLVTATRRTQSTQDIPVTVQALDEETLEQLGITTLNDYLLQLPSVTAGGNGGPGQNTIYIRGLASTTPNLSVSGVAGLAPNVAFYLDDQPLAQPGRNLDVYAADLARIEVLSGPQGTLFGASSQAGTVRLITNKPDPSGTYGKVKFGGATIKGGDLSHNIETMVNIPVSERLTMRIVAYADNKGGWVDNVRGTRDARGRRDGDDTLAARFRPAGTARAN
ncbi:MAG: TonB-dependent receptor plug domain-containing protein, partial [Gammaproteobacteria bacterium]